MLKPARRAWLSQGTREPALIGPDGVVIRHAGALGLGRPILSAVAGHVHRQFQPAPDTNFVERATQMVLDHLFAGADGEKWIPCGEAADAKDLPPWDRSVRVALTVGGNANAEGTFDSFSVKPLETTTEK